MPIDPAHLRGLERLYAAAPTNQRYDDLVLSVTPEEAVIEVSITPDLHHSAGAVHGAHCFKLLDDVAFFAANALVPDVFVLTAQMSIQLLRPVVAGRMQAVGHVTKPGRTLIFAASTLYGPDGKLIATGQGSFGLSNIRLADLAPYRGD